MPAADAVEASIEQLRSLGDKIKKQRAESTAALAEVRKQNAESTKKTLDEAQAKKKANRGGKDAPDGRERKAPVPSRRSNVVHEMSFGGEDDAESRPAAPAAATPAPVRPPEPPPTPPPAPAPRRQESIRFGYEDDEYADSRASTPPPPPAPEPAPPRSSGWSSNRSSRPSRSDDDDDYSEQSWLR